MICNDDFKVQNTQEIRNRIRMITT